MTQCKYTQHVFVEDDDLGWQELGLSEASFCDLENELFAKYSFDVSTSTIVHSTLLDQHIYCLFSVSSLCLQCSIPLHLGVSWQKI